MKTQYVVAVTVAIAMLAWAAGSAFTEDEAPKKPLSAAEMEGKAWQMGQPGPEHEHLKAFVGTWSGEGKAHSHTMGEIPVRGTVTQTLVMDGRFVRVAYEGPGPMGTMTGAGHMGYNRMASRFEGTWMMSLGTGISFTTGTYDEKTKTFAMTSAMKMIDGTTWPARQTMQFLSADTWVEKQYVTPTGGKEAVSFEMTYTRVKKDAAKKDAAK